MSPPIIGRVNSRTHRGHFGRRPLHGAITVLLGNVAQNDAAAFCQAIIYLRLVTRQINHMVVLLASALVQHAGVCARINQRCAWQARVDLVKLDQNVGRPIVIHSLHYEAPRGIRIPVFGCDPAAAYRAVASN